MFRPWANTEMMNLYLDEFARAYPDHEILIVWDQAGWHGSQALKLPANIRREALPAYSPELNPAERPWQRLRWHVTRNRGFGSEENLMDHLAGALQTFDRQQLATLR